MGIPGVFLTQEFADLIRTLAVENAAKDPSRLVGETIIDKNEINLAIKQSDPSHRACGLALIQEENKGRFLFGFHSWNPFVDQDIEGLAFRIAELHSEQRDVHALEVLGVHHIILAELVWLRCGDFHRSDYRNEPYRGKHDRPPSHVHRFLLEHARASHGSDPVENTSGINRNILTDATRSCKAPPRVVRSFKRVQGFERDLQNAP